MKNNESIAASNSRELLFVTDVPAWRCRTGAQQRIMGLIDYFSGLGWPVSICYLGSRVDERNFLIRTNDIEGLERFERLSVVSLSDDWKPDSLWERLTWQIRCMAHRCRSVFPKPAPSLPAAPPFAKRLTDFESPEFHRRFHRLVGKKKPDIVIIEYLSLVYLVPPPSDRKGILYWVDTHDVLSARCQQFQQLGMKHWIELSASEEQQAVNRFDGIIAIQPNEATQFKEMVTHDQPVVVAGHAFVREKNSVTLCAVDPPEISQVTSKKFTFGVLASNNAVNVQGVRWLRDEVWPLFQQELAASAHEVQLIVAGTVCSEIQRPELPRGFTCHGPVGPLQDFYDRVHVVLNPVQWGTGLKIKNVEALGFGKPLITTSHSIDGWKIPSQNQVLPWIEANTVSEFSSAMTLLVNDDNLRQRMAADALRISQTNLSCDVVYQDLKNCFLNH